MKNVFLAILLLSPFVSEAQIFKAAVALGVNLAQVDGDNSAGYHKPGLNLGPKVYTMFNDKFSLSMEMLYSQKGARSTINEFSAANAFKIFFDYAEVPILFNFHDRDRAIFGIGASYNALIRQKVIQGGIDITDDVPEINSYDVNFIADVTFRFKERFGINGRYAYSILPIAKWESSNFKGNSVYNNVISFRAMYFF